MEHYVVQLADREEPVAANGCVLRSHLLQRAAFQVAREDDVHDVLLREAALRSDRVHDCDGALDRDPVRDADLLGELTV